jgi:SAM-dependent methyltransferase
MVSSLREFAFEQHYQRITLPREQKLRSAFRKQIGRVDSLLDVGCGDGAVTLKVGEDAGATRIAGVDVVIRPKTFVEVTPYDGLHLPFGDKTFDVVTLMDVLHHCTDAQAVLTEALRVARMVVIKDHFAYGFLSRKLLHLMDIAGNARDSIASPGNYLEPDQWIAMIEAAGGRVAALDWPLAMHDLPWRAVVRPSLHFVAKVLPREA